jgi:hypothetical protein
VTNEAFIASALVGQTMPEKVNKQLDPSFKTPPNDGQLYTQNLSFHKCNV